MNKIPLSVVALAAVTAPVNAVAETTSPDEKQTAINALDQKKKSVDDVLAASILNLEDYHGKVKTKYSSIYSGFQAYVDEAYAKAKAQINGGNFVVEFPSTEFIAKIEGQAQEAAAEEKKYEAWDTMMDKEYKDLDGLNGTVEDLFAETEISKLPLTGAAQKAEFEAMGVSALLKTVKADDSSEGGNIDKLDEYKKDLKAKYDTLVVFNEQIGPREAAAQEAADQDAAVLAIQKAIDAATVIRNNTRIALIELLPTTPYYGYQTAALEELKTEIAALINTAQAEFDKVKTAGAHKQKDAIINPIKADVLNPIAKRIIDDWKAKKAVQEGAHDNWVATYNEYADKFETVQENVKKSGVTYLDDDVALYSTALNTLKQNIENKYNEQKIDQFVLSSTDQQSLQVIDFLVGKSNTALADKLAYDACDVLIKAKKKDLEDALKAAETEVKVGNETYTAAGSYKATYKALSDAITTVDGKVKAKFKVDDIKTAGSIKKYHDENDGINKDLAAIKIKENYSDKVAKTQQWFKDIRGTIDSNDELLNSKEVENEVAKGLIARAEDTSVSVSGEVYAKDAEGKDVREKTYGDAIKHYQDELGKITDALANALKADDTAKKDADKHYSLMEAASKLTVADFTGVDGTTYGMQTLIDNYGTTKVTYYQNVQIVAADQIVAQVKTQLTTANTELGKALDVQGEDYSKYGNQADVIKKDFKDLTDSLTKYSNDYAKYEDWKNADPEIPATTVIASLQEMQENLKALREGIAELQTNATNAEKNYKVYQTVKVYPSAVETAITNAQACIDGYTPKYGDERGKKFFTEKLNAYTTAKENLSSDIEADYAAVKLIEEGKQTAYETKKNQLVEQVQAIAMKNGEIVSGSFIDNEKAHDEQVKVRDAAIAKANKVYDDIEAKDQTSGAKDYLDYLASYIESLNNMTEKGGCISDSLANGLSVSGNAVIMAEIAKYETWIEDQRKAQEEDYNDYVIIDNNDQNKLFHGVYDDANKAFKEAISTLNNYATIKDETNMPLAQSLLTATHSTIQGYATELTAQYNAEDSAYNAACDKFELYSSLSYRQKVSEIQGKIETALNDYLDQVNSEAKANLSSSLAAAKDDLENAKKESPFAAFEYDKKDEAFISVQGIIDAVDKAADDNDPEFAYKAFKNDWFGELSAETRAANITAAKEQAAKDEYNFQKEKYSAINKADTTAILTKCLNIDAQSYVDDYRTELQKYFDVAVAAYAQIEAGKYYKKIDIILNYLTWSFTSGQALELQTRTIDKKDETHTKVYWTAYDAEAAAVGVAKAYEDLSELVVKAEGRIDDAAAWFNELYTAHTTNPLVRTGVDQFISLASDFDDDADAVNNKTIIDVVANKAEYVARLAEDKKFEKSTSYDKRIQDAKTQAIEDELDMAQILINTTKEDYNELARINGLENAAQFDNSMKGLQDALDKIDSDLHPTDPKKAITLDAAKGRLITLEGQIATLDGDIVKATDGGSKKFTEAHNALNTALTKQAAAIAAAQKLAGEFEVINDTYGDALAVLAADNKTLTDDEAKKYEDRTILIYQDNINNDIKAIQEDLDDILKGDAELQGLTDLHARYTTNKEVYTDKVDEINLYQDKLNTVVGIVSTYEYYTGLEANQEAIQALIDAATSDLQSAYEAITVGNINSGLTDTYEVTGKTSIIDKLNTFEKDAAYTECSSLYNNKVNDIYLAANRTFNAIANQYDELGRRYNPTAEKELREEKTTLACARSDVYRYYTDSYKGYVYYDIDGNPCYTVVDGVQVPKTVNFLREWYDVIRTRLTELNTSLVDFQQSVEERCHVLGDVNLSGSINVADYDEVRKMILSDVADFDAAVEKFTEAKAYAADVNEDEAIDVADLTSISNFIFNGGFDKTVIDKAARAKALAKVQCDDVLSLQAVSEETTLTGKTMRLAVNLDNSTDYVNYQMDVKLPEGMTLVGEKLTERANGHQLSSAALSNGSFRMVAENVENVAFGNQTAAVLYLDVQVDANYNGGEVEISNIIFSDAKGNAYRMSGLQTNAPTGIDSITAPTMTERIYSVGGQMMKAMKKGVNIIKGEGTVKKVVKK